MSSSDYETMLKYSNDQVYAIKAEERRRAYPNRTAIRKRWPPILPWQRRPIRKQIEVWDDWGFWELGNENWNKPYVSHRFHAGFSATIGYRFVSLLDPKLSRRIYRRLFPKTTSPLSFNAFSYCDDTSNDSHLVDFAVFENGVVNQVSQKIKATRLLPLAAVVEDAFTVISEISTLASDGEPIDWNKIFEKTLPLFHNNRAPVDSSEYHRIPDSKERFQGKRSYFEFLNVLLFTHGQPGPSFDPRRIQISETDPRETWFKVAGFSKQDREPLLHRLESLKLDFSNIDASFICSGPFRLMLTTRMDQHLLLRDDGYLQVFWDFGRPGASLRTFSGHFLWGRERGDSQHRFSSCWKCSNASEWIELMTEITLSHVMLFQRSTSRRIAEEFYGVDWEELFMWLKFDGEVLEDGPWWGLKVDYVLGRDKVLEQFPYLAPRLVNLLEKMENWGPRTVWELGTPGYKDRVSWWAAIFGLFFGCVSMLLVFLSIYQAVLIQLQLDWMRSHA
jgi:hypothetical protein